MSDVANKTSPDQPITFQIEGPRAKAIASALSSTVSPRYVLAWHKAVNRVLADNGWLFPSGDSSEEFVVTRVRYGRPRVIDGTLIDAQLVQALSELDSYLDSELIDDSNVAVRTCAGHRAGSV